MIYVFISYLELFSYCSFKLAACLRLVRNSVFTVQYHTYFSEGVLNFIYANILIRITHRLALIRIIIATYMKSCQITFHICRSRCFGVMHNILGRLVDSNFVYAFRFACNRDRTKISFPSTFLYFFVYALHVKYSACLLDKQNHHLLHTF